MRRPNLALFLIATTTFVLADDFPYQKPPKEILDALNAPLTPTISVSPQRDYAILMQPVRYPPIAEVAQPMLRLAGIRIDSNTNGMHLAPMYTSFSLKRISDGADIRVSLPAQPKLGAPVWSPDGRQFAFTNTGARDIELWIGSTATGQARRIEGAAINGVRMAAGGGRGGAGGGTGAIEWMDDSKTLIAHLIPAKRGAAPAESAIPRGPHAQESLGHAGPAPTYEDLLSTPHDEDLFDYYATSQLAYIDTPSGSARPFGKPAIFTMVRPSPDEKHLLVGRIHRPYSYQLPGGRFPQEIEVWDRNANVEYKVASLPLEERTPIGGVRTGPRAYEWLPDKAATLLWVEALDGGNPREKATYRDEILANAAPFQGKPTEIFRTKERFRGLQPLADGKALVEDYERVSRVVRTMEIDLGHPGSEAKVISSRNERDEYKNPGTPVSKTDAQGRRRIIQVGDEILMSGLGASPTGDHPFVDRFNLATGKTERLFQSDAKGYEVVEAVLDDSGSKLLTRRESPTDPPNYFVRDGANVRPLTHFTNPMPQTAKIRKQLVNYKRADGVPLSFTLYLPPDYKPGSRLPAVVWAYPYEFSDVDTASQVTGHAAQAYPELNYHQLFVLHGYALIDNAAMPIIGDPDTVNNTYVEQLTMDAQAAVDKAVEMGVADREKIGVFGHSYGAFMTANLLAHTNIFHAGVAESGAYNRTLTPFGFQSEQRTFWQAQDVYTKMSPFWFADKIKTPVLLIHGEADDNTGTFPIQSERLYAAIRGNGGTVRLVMLPNEAHGYRGKETMEHVLFEEISWFDKYLK
ncbi:MAG TPA: prolyl oligopeptidase family serine peptidase [Bryobacteraceae bacterium]|nr:prolyl oligopeptidase family serine peptidase [Bryobacteraceae bacterium]